MATGKEEKETQIAAAEKKKNCFVIMPISDMEGYDSGHFGRVYEHLIKPACIEAGLEPVRADEVKNTNFIVLDILKRILQSDMAICDLSGRNPNVLYELGIRQAFNLPVTLIKDKKTKDIFDIQALRFVEYNETLRIDHIKNDIENVKIGLLETFDSDGKDINSIVQLLGIHAAERPKKVEISKETELILNAILNIGNRIKALEDDRLQSSVGELNKLAFRAAIHSVASKAWADGNPEYHSTLDEILGTRSKEGASPLTAKFVRKLNRDEKDNE